MRRRDRGARSIVVVLGAAVLAASWACSSAEEAGTSGGDAPSPAGDASVTEGDGGSSGANDDAAAQGVRDGAADATGSPNDAGADADAEPVDAGADAAPAGPLSPTYVNADINHVLVTGQSNAVSNAGDPVLSTTQPYTNVMFDTGVMPMWGRPNQPNQPCDGEGCTTYQMPTSLVPLVEGDKFLSAFGKETCGAGLANQIAFLATGPFELGTRPGYPTKHDVLVTNHGRSGNTYWCLRKYVPPTDQGWTNTTCNYKPGYLRPFDQAISEVQSAKALAQAAGKSYVVRGVVTIHGESDHYSNLSEFPLSAHDGTPNAVKDYSDALVEWQKDYEASVQAITGQTEPVPLFVVGISGWTDVEYSKVPVQELAAHVKAPGKVVLVGPGYPLPNAPDCLHYSSQGQRQLGQYVAKAYAQVVLGGKKWEPLRPVALARAGAAITISYVVPTPPLVFDTVRVNAAKDMGFRVRVNGADATIASVALAGADKVQITLAQAPAPGATVRVWYGMQRIDGNQCIGPTNGPRGNLRDSDQTASQTGNDLSNWSVQFDELVP